MTPPTFLYCRATMTPVEHNRMRPGYDCRCTGCMDYVAAQPKREPTNTGLVGASGFVPWGSEVA